MTDPLLARDPDQRGLWIRGTGPRDVADARREVVSHLARFDLADDVIITEGEDACGHCVGFRLREDLAADWAREDDTTRLCRRLGLDTHGSDADLEREILVCLLVGPLPVMFPSHDELAAAVRMRRNIVAAGRRTSLAFDTAAAERPAEYWTYERGRGFTLLPGKPLIEALRKTTQPGENGRLYSFSCYRATEYVILLGIAEELAHSNVALFERLQRQWQERAIQSGEFHEVFLREHGTMESPLPLKYFVPGDRVWFRNPDERSSDASGFEGSWVLYLGDGRFTNFWKCGEPFTLTTKCVELFHWRDGVYTDADGNSRIDEDVVAERVRASLADPAEVERILAIMLRHREPKGIYVDGGCIDTTREFPRWVCPGTADLALPAH